MSDCNVKYNEREKLHYIRTRYGSQTTQISFKNNNLEYSDNNDMNTVEIITSVNQQQRNKIFPPFHSPIFPLTKYTQCEIF